MKKFIICALLLCTGLGAGFGIGSVVTDKSTDDASATMGNIAVGEESTVAEDKGAVNNSENYSDEMKFDDGVDISKPDGPDSVERLADHPDSPYFLHPDVYNMTSTDTLTILHNFKTIQQSSEWSCGAASALMVLEWYGMRNDRDEQTLAALRPQGLEPVATSLSQMIDIFDGIGGFKCYSALDAGEDASNIFTFDFIRKTLADGNPIMIGWNDWGGHWQVIIGYDDMGTEAQQDDVLIVADPYDTTDHNQDGYGIYPAQRFWYNFTFYDYFDESSGEINDMCFLVAVPEQTDEN